MNIGLVVEYSKNNDINENIKTIINRINESSDIDLLLFSESFLQEFNSLTWNYESDIKIAISKNSELLNPIRVACKQKRVAVGFGYFEKDNKNIYCSYMIVNKEGETLHNYQRLSIGWKEYRITTNNYQEGSKLESFTIANFKSTVCLCGDLWDRNIIDRLIDLIKKDSLDFVIWPNHLDYTKKQFIKELKEYLNQTKDINIPILLINDITPSSIGFAFVFKNGQIIDKTSFNNKEILVFKLR